jgi:hypothetical protein
MPVPKKQLVTVRATSAVAKKLNELSRLRMEKKIREAEEKRLRDYVLAFLADEGADACRSSELEGVRVEVSGQVSWRDVVEQLIGDGLVSRDTVSLVASQHKSEGYQRLDVKEIR